MTIRPKTKRRLLYLAAGTVVVGGSMGLFFRYRLNLADAAIMQHKTDGIRAYNAGDYAIAIADLSYYLPRHSDDAEAVLDLGLAYSKSPTKDGSFISNAVRTLRHYCTLVPDNRDVQDQLLEMEEPYAVYASPALDLARQVLKTHPDDLVALKTIAEIQERNYQFDEAATAADVYTALNPTDLDMQQLALYLMQKTGKHPQEIRARAQKLVDKYPDDPRFLVVKAWACEYGQGPSESSEQKEQDNEQAAQLLLQASHQNPPDSRFVQIVVESLDNCGEYGASQALLDRAAARMDDPQVLSMLVERLWQSQQLNQVLARLSNFDASSPTADPSLIAFKAMSLYGVGRRSDADALVAILNQRGDTQRSAAAWAQAIAATFANPPLPAATLANQCADAAAKDPRNGVIAWMLGNAWSSVGENGLALQEWRKAAERDPSWTSPYVRIALLLTSTGAGGSDEAYRAAQAALQTSAVGKTRNSEAVVADIRVRFARLGASPDPAEVSRLLTEVGELQSQIHNEPLTLPIYVTLLARTGQRNQAISAVEAAIANPGPNGQSLLLELAEVSRATGLDLSSSIYSAIQSHYGASPALAFDQARTMLAAGHSEQGLKLLQSARGNKPANPAEWDLLICEYRQISHDPEAAQAWEALGDAYPNEFPVQNALVSSENSAWSDRDFMQRTIDRLEKLTGEQAITWKIARARYLLSSADPQHDAAAAVVTLSEVIKSAPDQVEPHMLLAQAYDILHNRDSALTEWRRVAELSSGSPTALLGLLRAQQQTGDAPGAAATFDNLINLPNLPDDVALQAAIVMLAQGDAARALTALQAHPRPSDIILYDATLARVDRQQGRLGDAANLYFELEKRDNLDAPTIAEAADFFGAQNDLPAARRFLARLDNANAPAPRKQLMLAAFEERFGNPGVARNLYAQAAVAGGDDPAATVVEIGYLLRTGQLDAARTATADALKRWPNNPSLTALSGAESSAESAPQTPEVSLLLQAMSIDPQNPAAKATMDVLAAGASPTDTLSQLTALLQKYPDFQPLYEITVQRMLELNQPDAAAPLANKAMAQFPNSADAARLAAETYARLGRWTDAAGAARQWRQRSADQPRAADVFFARIDLMMNQPGDAVQRLAPYVTPAAKAQPDRNELLLTTYADALIRAGDEADAATLLRPFAEHSAKWRAAWLALAAPAHADAASAAAWIAQVKPLLDAGSIEEQTKLAEAEMALADRFGDAAGYAAAHDALKPLLQSPAITTHALMVYARAAEGMQDSATAEQAYRRVLAIDPHHVAAMNNLADLLRQKKDDPQALAEAEALAHQAIAASPSDPNIANYYDTLARVQWAEKHLDDAVASFEQGNRLQPKNLNVLAGLADLSVRMNHLDAAMRYLGQIDALIPPGVQAPARLEDEINATRVALHNASGRSSLSDTDLTPATK